MPAHGPQVPLLIEVDPHLVLCFRREAARRGTPVRSLIHDLLDAIAHDHPTAAILDDEAVKRE